MTLLPVGWLLLKIGLGAIGILTFYRLVILRPQILFLKRKISLPEYQGTAHQRTMAFSLGQLERAWRRLRLVIILIGLFLAGALPILFR